MSLLRDDHAVAGRWGEFVHAVFEELEGKHFSCVARRDAQACVLAFDDFVSVLTLRALTDDDRRAEDSLVDLEDHWGVVLILI